MEARLKNPTMLLPDVMPAIQSLLGATYKAGVPPATLALVHLRASQMNGCHLCLETGMCHAQKAGETDDRLFAIAGWRTASCFTPAERAALALTESVTALSKDDPVPDAVWNETAKYYDEQGIAALLLAITMANMFNRFNIATRQVEATW